VACLAADPGMMRFAGLLKRPTLPRHAPIRQEAASDRASALCQDLLRNGNNRFSRLLRGTPHAQSCL